jgi:hypothetical protein
VACSNSAPKRDFSFYYLSDHEVSLLQEGDILLRQGYGLVSNMIVKSLGEALPVSHVGLLTKDPFTGKFKIIHSVSQSISDYDGVQSQDLQSFIRDSQPNSLIVVRYRNMDQLEHAHRKITLKALEYLEQKVPFDYSFDYNNPERFFCTELIVRIFNEVFSIQFLSDDFLKNVSQLDRLKFDFLLDSSRFEVILNHQGKL